MKPSKKALKLDKAKRISTYDMYEKFKQELITRIQDDIEKSKQRADAHRQSCNKEPLAFEKGLQNALCTTLFDINDLDHDYYETFEKNI
ncbi:MAG: hypothetical protein Unbinned1473contig1000_42 [Prokaryotic dsDNA virus sp.]|nr:MAG: hypothetical protein Unbinned1473contig1000_42 [Prokaryotic dsDNA virus sp.]|tara:strand:+ start:94 stop:360 length:267 start_codon:yes stop_codon:yes gene_type:complete